MLTTLTLIGLALSTQSTPPAAQPTAKATATQEAAVVPTPAPTPLDRFKEMKGSWDADLTGDGVADSVVEYKVVGAGSAVVETLFPGSEHEMVTVYHMNGKELMCTHYCAAGNQPRLVGKVSEGAAKETIVAFTMKDITNLASPKTMHMNAVTFTFAADGTVHSHWSSIEDGQAGHSADFRMKRRP